MMSDRQEVGLGREGKGSFPSNAQAATTDLPSWTKVGELRATGCALLCHARSWT